MELNDIKGIGAKRILSLRKAGIFSCEDLLNHFPKRYYDFSNAEDYLEDGVYRLIFVRLIEKPKVFNSKKIKILTVKAQTSSGKNITLYFYGQTFLKATLKEGQYIYAYGKNSPKKKNAFVVSMQKMAEKMVKGIFAVYKTMEGLGQETLKNAIKSVLNSHSIVSLIPEEIAKNYGLLALSEAYLKVHFPETKQDIEDGVKRISLENALIFAHVNYKRKIYSKTNRDYAYISIEQSLESFKNKIPFSLTKGQLLAIEDLVKDFSSKTVANRLIEGDTGCGKTMVAFWAMSLACQSGFQSAMMAPTEILARQHYDNAVNIFGKENLAFLAGSTKQSVKKEIYSKLKTGEIKMLFGTHSLFSSGVEFKNLRLAIVDEQHRFGVAERAMLAGKTQALDYISLSATPIPRSVSLVLYGGLDITQIKEKPHKADIQTNLVPFYKKQDMWNFVHNKIDDGASVYVVCPKIDDDEEKDSLASTTKITKELEAEFGADIVCELNGKMKDERKNDILNKFKNGEIKLLVSTSVVEVGVDAKTASIMVIYNPERFGLASLHQLRGRVGRMGQKSYCFCLLSENINEKQFERLSFFKNNNNGFDIADYDLESRGAGDVFGTRQHGEKSVFNINLSIYNIAKEIHTLILEKKCDLSALDFACNEKYSSLLKDVIMN